MKSSALNLAVLRNLLNFAHLFALVVSTSGRRSKCYVGNIAT